MIRVWMDCETFGMNPNKNPLATVYMALYTADDDFIADIDLKVKPDNMEGLEIDHKTTEIHGIVWAEHIENPETITYSEAKKKIQDFLEGHKLPKVKKSFKPCGQNVAFDINYLKNTVFSYEEWDKLFHHRFLDTLIVLNYLQDLDLVPPDLGSLTSLVEFFDLKTGDFHDARADIKMTVQVYRKQRDLILGLKKANILASSNVDLLKVVED
jgi:oligoribonuclease (3'-5' exoribonuclease)